MENLVKDMFNSIFSLDVFSELADKLSINLFTGTGSYAAVVNAVKLIYDSVITPVALCLLCIYFMVGMVDKLTAEHFSWEQAMRQFCMLLAGFALIDKGWQIMELLSSLGATVVRDLESTLGYGDPTGAGETHIATLYQNFCDQTKVVDISWLDWINGIVRMCYLLVPYIVHWILSMAVTVVVWTRVIEIYVRAAFAPIAFSDFFHHGFQGGGWRFLKSFLATCLQGALMLVIMVIFINLSSLVFTSSNDYMQSMGLYLAFLFSAIMLMFKSLSLAKEIVGAQ